MLYCHQSHISSFCFCSPFYIDSLYTSLNNGASNAILCQKIYVKFERTLSIYAQTYFIPPLDKQQISARCHFSKTFRGILETIFIKRNMSTQVKQSVAACAASDSQVTMTNMCNFYISVAKNNNCICQTLIILVLLLPIAWIK